jgi:hypothetical protein
MEYSRAKSRREFLSHLARHFSSTSLVEIVFHFHCLSKLGLLDAPFPPSDVRKLLRAIPQLKSCQLKLKVFRQPHFENLILDPYLSLARLQPKMRTSSNVKLETHAQASMTRGGDAAQSVGLGDEQDDDSTPRCSKRLRGVTSDEDVDSAERSERRARVH